MASTKRPNDRLHAPPQILVHLPQSGVVKPVQFQVPLGKLHVDIDPILPGRFACHQGTDSIRHGGVIQPHSPRHNLPCIEQLLAGRKNLAGVHRFGQIIVDPMAQRFLHQTFLFVLRYHDDGDIGIDFLDHRQRGKPASTRHHFIQKDDVEPPLLHHRDGVVPVRHRRDFIPAGTQKHRMRPQEVNFVVCPQNLLFFHSVHTPGRQDALRSSTGLRGSEMRNVVPMPGRLS